ncbi:MAG TPA: hypothetical protein VI750_02965 [Pyrinomonadaceae bacterium]|nr:hypothetical protein [Pyrinomonadaceae bacterium]
MEKTLDEGIFQFEYKIALQIDEHHARLKIYFKLPKAKQEAVDRDIAKFPIKWFQDEEGKLDQPRLDIFTRVTIQEFRRTATHTALVDFVMHLQRIGHLVAAHIGISDLSVERAIRELTEAQSHAIGYRMREYMAQDSRPAGRGNYSGWTAQTLHGCIVLAMRRCTPNNRSMAAVSELMRGMYPKKWGKGTETALKQLVARFRKEHGPMFEWRELQRFADLMADAPKDPESGENMTIQNEQTA